MLERKMFHYFFIGEIRLSQLTSLSAIWISVDISLVCAFHCYLWKEKMVTELMQSCSSPKSLIVNLIQGHLIETLWTKWKCQWMCVFQLWHQPRSLCPQSAGQSHVWETSEGARRPHPIHHLQIEISLFNKCEKTVLHVNFILPSVSFSLICNAEKEPNHHLGWIHPHFFCPLVKFPLKMRVKELSVYVFLHVAACAAGY